MCTLVEFDSKFKGEESSSVAPYVCMLLVRVLWAGYIEGDWVRTVRVETHKHSYVNVVHYYEF